MAGYPTPLACIMRAIISSVGGMRERSGGSGSTEAGTAKSKAAPGAGGAVIGVGKLIMIASAFVLTIRNLPILAEEGTQQVVLLGIAIVVFLIPTALVSAELATGWPKQGGVYAWVKEAFGERWGFVAIWLQWVQMPLGMVAILSFVAAGFAYAFNPGLADNGLFLAVVIIASYWILTLLSFRGMGFSGWISTVCVIVGVFIPAVVLIGLGIAYVFMGDQIQISFALNADNWIPNLGSIQSLTLMGAIVFIFSGMETSAAHANEVRDPQRNYPRAILVAALILFVMNLAGGLSVAAVVPKDDLSLVSGLFQALEVFLGAFSVSWAAPVLALMVAIGGIGQVSTWIVGPVKGLLSTAEEGDIPPVFSRVNRNDIPTRLLFLQASCVTVGAAVFIVVGINTALVIVLNALIMIYCLMYLLLFLSAIRLRYSQPDTERAYRVGRRGNWLMVLVSVIGILASLFVIFIGWIPPEALEGTTSLFEYRMIIGVTLVVAAALPFVIYALRRPEWKAEATPLDEIAAPVASEGDRG